VATDFTVVEAASFEEVAEFQPEWDRLASQRRWPFAEFAWTRDCAKHLFPDAKLAIYLVLRREELAAAVALCRPKRSAHAALEIVGSTMLREANPLLADDAAALPYLVTQLALRKTPFALSRILDSEELEPALRLATRGLGHLMVRHPRGAPYLVLSETMENFEKSLSANRRSDLARKRRKLSGLGTVEYESRYPSREEVADDLREFEAIEATGWKGQQGSAIALRAGFHDFFSAVLGDMAATRRVRVDQLRLDGKTIAMQLGLVSGARYFLIKPTFDERWASVSPGYQLTYESIRTSIADRLEVYEFLGSEDSWKLHWTRTVRRTTSWVYYPYRLQGLVRFALDAVEAFRRRR
jgi:CelD/BcsL family acetyltransferase involved in cellulose biosynthesis